MRVVEAERLCDPGQRQIALVQHPHRRTQLQIENVPLERHSDDRPGNPIELGIADVEHFRGGCRTDHRYGHMLPIVQGKIVGKPLPGIGIGGL